MYLHFFLNSSFLILYIQRTLRKLSLGSAWSSLSLWNELLLVMILSLLNNNSRRQHGQFVCIMHHWCIQLWWNSCLQSSLMDDDSKIMSPSTKSSKQIAHCGDIDTGTCSCCGCWCCTGSMQRWTISPVHVLWWSSQHSNVISSVEITIGGVAYFLQTRTRSRYCIRSSAVIVCSFVCSISSFSLITLFHYSKKVGSTVTFDHACVIRWVVKQSWKRNNMRVTYPP